MYLDTGDKIFFGCISVIGTILISLLVWALLITINNDKRLMEECMKGGNPEYYCHSLIKRCRV
jgi:hypothetical protein